jgi:hypothetical protein
MYSYDRRCFLQSGAAVTGGLLLPAMSGITAAHAGPSARFRHHNEFAQENVEVIGYSDVGKRPPFKLAIQRSAVAG